MVSCQLISAIINSIIYILRQRTVQVLRSCDGLKAPPTGLGASHPCHRWRTFLSGGELCRLREAAMLEKGLSGLGDHSGQHLGDAPACCQCCAGLGSRRHLGPGVPRCHSTAVSWPLQPCFLSRDPKARSDTECSYEDPSGPCSASYPWASHSLRNRNLGGIGNCRVEPPVLLCALGWTTHPFPSLLFGQGVHDLEREKDLDCGQDLS